MDQATGQIVMLAEFAVREDRRADFLAYTTANLAISRAATGNLAFDILVDEADNRRILFYEVWDNAAAQQTYLAWRIQRGDLETLQSYLAAPPSFTRLCRVE